MAAWIWASLAPLSARACCLRVGLLENRVMRLPQSLTRFWASAVQAAAHKLGLSEPHSRQHMQG